MFSPLNPPCAGHCRTAYVADLSAPSLRATCTTALSLHRSGWAKDRQRQLALTASRGGCIASTSDMSALAKRRTAFDMKSLLVYSTGSQYLQSRSQDSAIARHEGQEVLAAPSYVVSDISAATGLDGLPILADGLTDQKEYNKGQAAIPKASGRQQRSSYLQPLRTGMPRLSQPCAPITLVSSSHPYIPPCLVSLPPPSFFRFPSYLLRNSSQLLQVRQQARSEGLLTGAQKRELRKADLKAKIGISSKLGRSKPKAAAVLVHSC